MRAAVLPCEVAIKKCNAAPESSACTAAFAICNYGENIPYQLTGYNPYDMRIKCASGNLCYDFSEVDKFLQRPETMQAIGATKKWTECNRLVNVMFQQDWMKNYQTKLPDLLGGRIRVLVSAPPERIMSFSLSP